MPWFMDPMPDGDSVHQVAQAYQQAHAAYIPHIQTTQTALTTTTQVWTGPGSDAHSRVVAVTQQHANEHAGWLVAIANVLYVVGTLLKIVFVLQMAWIALQALTFITSILTAGATAAEGEAGAAMLEAAITGLRAALQAIMRAAGQALMRLVIGASAGALTGLAVGINTVETNHLSGWNAVWTVGLDTLGGAGAGAMIATNPIALAGTGVALGQIATNAALGGPTSFEQAGAQWAQQTFGNIPVAGGLIAPAFQGPTDLNSAFNTIVADTLAVGGVSAMFRMAETGNVDVQPVQCQNGPGLPVTGPEADAANAELNNLDAYRNDPQNAAQGGQHPGEPRAAAASGSGTDQTFLSGYPEEQGPVAAFGRGATRGGLGSCAEYKYVSWASQHLGDLPPGDINVYEVQRSFQDPCPSCRNAFQWLADNSGRNVVVYWRDGAGNVFKWIFNPQG